MNKPDKIRTPINNPPCSAAAKKKGCLFLNQNELLLVEIVLFFIISSFRALCRSDLTRINPGWINMQSSVELISETQI